VVLLRGHNYYGFCECDDSVDSPDSLLKNKYKKEVEKRRKTNVKVTKSAHYIFIHTKRGKENRNYKINF